MRPYAHRTPAVPFWRVLVFACGFLGACRFRFLVLLHVTARLSCHGYARDLWLPLRNQCATPLLTACCAQRASTGEQGVVVSGQGRDEHG